jgi:hypothetical protein
MCSHSRLTQQRQKYVKEISEAGFRLFWNNINQQMMDYQSLKKENNCTGILENSRKMGPIMLEQVLSVA